MTQNYTEFEHYIQYEILFWKFRIWICFGKQAAIENGVSKRVQIIIRFTTKNRKRHKVITLMK